MTPNWLAVSQKGSVDCRLPWNESDCWNNGASFCAKATKVGASKASTSENIRPIRWDIDYGFEGNSACCGERIRLNICSEASDLSSYVTASKYFIACFMLSAKENTLLSVCMTIILTPVEECHGRVTCLLARERFYGIFWAYVCTNISTQQN